MVSSSGWPTPAVWWFRNDRLVDNSSTVMSPAPHSATAPGATGTSPGSPGVAHVTNELVIPSLGRSDLHSQLTCQAANNNRSLPLATTVHVDMNFRPLDVRVLGASQPLSAGRRYDLLCQSSGSRPPASVTWWKNGQRLERTKETTSSDGNTTTSTLSMVATKDDAGKFLTCKSENPILSTEPLEDTWTLEIQYVPEAILILGTSLNPDNIREGSDVYFDCKVSAVPPVYKVEWRHNGRPLAHNIQAGVIVSNQSLVLQGVSRTSAGNYTCVGYNSEGDGESEPFYLNVLYSPTCAPNQTRVHGVAKQEKANISCTVEANPPEVHFRWTFNNSADTVDVAAAHIGRGLTAPRTSTLTYTPNTELDYGTLLCWATNRIGSQRHPCVFHIIAAGHPDPVHNCSISNASLHSFAVRCSEGFNGGLPQAFLLEVKEAESQRLRANVTSLRAPRFEVAGLEPGLSYHATVIAFNQKGRSDGVVLTASTVRLPERQLTVEKERPRPGFRFTPMMSVLVGVVSALFIVAVVVSVVLRFQCTGRREGGSGEGEEEGGEEGGKTDAGDGTNTDSDEKNPDIIPQANAASYFLPLEPEEQEFLRKRQHISTIETQSPARLQSPGSFAGYCTLRNGMPLQDLNNIGSKPKMKPVEGGVPYPQCTLPRQHWPSYSGMASVGGPGSTMTMGRMPQGPPPGPHAMYPGGMMVAHHPMESPLPMGLRGHAAMPPHPMSLPPLPSETSSYSSSPPLPPPPSATLLEEEPDSPDTPLMVAKRESTV
ncbi:hemicentin-1 [Ischnura elegans]|uniref:hemicentin-1 n=1 Tax=Ischnura elegans TaxID=197161 RepID=UPI001ED889CB|nr:hemicentin-1 [Ischnura elegans]